MSAPRPLFYSLNQIPPHEKPLKRQTHPRCPWKTKTKVTDAYTGNSHLEQPKPILVTSTVTLPLLPHQGQPFIEFQRGGAPDPLWKGLEEGPISTSVSPSHPSHTVSKCSIRK